MLLIGFKAFGQAISMNQIIPLTTAPNQSFPVALTVNGNALNLNLSISYNEIIQYWIMSISDNNQNILLSNIPLLTGVFPAANVLSQYEYMQIGEAYVLDVSNVSSSDYPNSYELGTDFVLMWSDNEDYSAVNSLATIPAITGQKKMNKNVIDTGNTRHKHRSILR